MALVEPERRTSDENSNHLTVYERLKLLAINYRFRPGQQLMIGQLAEHFGVSSTPVRETLIRLHAEGFLDSTTRRGFFAKTLNLKEMADLFELRFFLLRASLEQAMAAIKGNVALALHDLISLPGDDAAAPWTTRRGGLVPDQLEDGLALDEAASRTIVAFSRNKILLETINNANDRTHYVRKIDFESPKRRDESRGVFSALFLSIERQDVASAALLLKKSFDGQMETLPGVVSQGISRAYTNPSWVVDFQMPQEAPVRSSNF